MASDILAFLTYTTPEKTVGWIEQTVTTKTGTLTLRRDEIECMHHSYPLQSIWDCSFKPFSDGTCLFYLHTNQGVRTFHVKTDPSFFLNTYKKLRSNLYL